jgi:hypothetical protein
MCRGCYERFRRAGSSQLTKLAKACDIVGDEAARLTAIRIETERRLTDALPEVADLAIKAARESAKRGDGKTALRLLESVGVSPDKRQRILHPVQPDYAQIPHSPRIVIGFSLGGTRRAADAIDIEAAVEPVPDGN